MVVYSAAFARVAPATPYRVDTAIIHQQVQSRSSSVPTNGIGAMPLPNHPCP